MNGNSSAERSGGTGKGEGETTDVVEESTDVGGGEKEVEGEGATKVVQEEVRVGSGPGGKIGEVACVEEVGDGNEDSEALMLEQGGGGEETLEGAEDLPAMDGESLRGRGKSGASGEDLLAGDETLFEGESTRAGGRGGGAEGVEGGERVKGMGEEIVMPENGLGQIEGVGQRQSGEAQRRGQREISFQTKRLWRRLGLE